ncbi:predicted protein [Naegleria gruberi]|uniref:Predicted protein n=1 Tax=Naegleria gruberi TaxID=5762 RepID=D2VQH1_NAEGR|nr:uncharacterized protein NAEGRDRAFT_71224 [Naegleria gruberi]EFC40869.1 predicted protein [Naegleria gruberi]|eukprot:XP_002673613.1 predicted protein [Naegleria gruberi strain NEG-M]
MLCANNSTEVEETSVKRKREEDFVGHNKNESAEEHLSTTSSSFNEVVDDQIEPQVKKIKTELELKAGLVDEDLFPKSGSKLYTDDDETRIEDIWHVKYVRKIILDVLDADLTNWQDSEGKHLLDELIERREEIESISLFLAESMIKKVTIHDTKYIKEMISNLNIPDMVKTLEEELTEDYPRGSNTLKYWLKYILPEIVKKQNELNLIESNEESEKLSPEEEKEKDEILNSMQYDEKEEDGYAFLLDSCNLSVPSEIKTMIDNEEEKCEEIEETSDDYIIDNLFNEYIFNKTLPDERGEHSYNISPFKGILTEDAASLQEDNPFLSILEKTIRMSTNNEYKEEHQDLLVSPMRLGLSLLILDCLNRELSLAFNRRYYLYFTGRPIVRAVLDHLIDFDPNKVYFKQPPGLVEMNGRVFSESLESRITEEHIRQVKNVFDISKPIFNNDDYGFEIDESDTESESSDEVIDETDDDFENSTLFSEYGEHARDDFKKPRYENFQYGPCGGNINVRFTRSEHPFWSSFPLSQKNLVMLNNYQLNSYCPVPLTIESSSDWLYTEEKLDGEEEIQVPLHQQKIVSLFPNELDEENGNMTIPAVDHLIHVFSDARHQPPTQNSIHIDINRLFRRAGNMSFSSGALVEGFLSLKSFISRIIETLMVIKRDDLVTKLDIVDALNICNYTHYPDLKISQPSEQKYIPIGELKFTTEPMVTPENFEDVQVEGLEVFLSRTDPNGNEMSEDETITMNADYDYVVNNSTFADHITLFLNDPNLYNDSFIELNGHRVHIYTPIIKHRCPKMYEEHFSTPEKRNQGFILNNENDFTFDMVFHWIESYYLGSFQPMNDNNRDTENFYLLLRSYEIKYNAVYKGDYSSDDPEDLKDGEEYELDGLDPSNTCFTLHSLYNDEETKDFQLSFVDHTTMEKKTRKVHKYILACRSPFFRQIFEGNYTDRVTDNFDIGDIFKDEKSVDAFIYYLYHNFIVIPTLNPNEFEPRNMGYFDLKDILSEKDTSTKQDSANLCAEENEINLYLSLFISSDYLMVDGLKNLCENVIGSLVDEENFAQLLEFSNEQSSETIFSFVDNFLLSSSLVLENPQIINQDISLYYTYLSGPITLENVAERIRLTLELVDKSESQLYRFHKERLEEFHIPQLVSFILKNYDFFSQQEYFYQPFNEIKYSEYQSVWEHVSAKYWEMNPRY